MVATPFLYDSCIHYSMTVYPDPIQPGLAAPPATIKSSVLVSITPKVDRPKWLRAPAPVGKNYRELKDLIERLRLHTDRKSVV